MVTNEHRKKRSTKIASDYDVENISMKILRIILSYIDYIKKFYGIKYMSLHNKVLILGSSGLIGHQYTITCKKIAISIYQYFIRKTK